MHHNLPGSWIYKYAQAATIFVSVAACTSPTGPGNLDVEVERRTGFVSYGGYTAIGGGGYVQATGRYGSSACPRREDAYATLRGDTITFVIDVDDRPRGDCESILRTVEYGAEVRGVPAGNYLFRIEHFGTTDLEREPNRPEIRHPDGLRFESMVVVQ